MHCMNSVRKPVAVPLVELITVLHYNKNTMGHLAALPVGDIQSNSAVGDGGTKRGVTVWQGQALRTAHSAHLGEDDGDDGLRVDEAGVAQVVQAAGLEDLRAGLEPHGLAKLRAMHHDHQESSAADAQPDLQDGTLHRCLSTWVHPTGLGTLEVVNKGRGGHLHAVLGEQLGGHAAQGAEHGPPGVDHLDLTVPAQGTA